VTPVEWLGLWPPVSPIFAAPAPATSRFSHSLGDHMPVLSGILLTIAAILCGLVGTMIVERFAPHLGLVQAPNARSSHINPTPRGGGIAIAVSVTLGIGVLASAGTPELWAIAALTLAIAMLGFADDLWDLSPALRFPIQIVVVLALVWWNGALPVIALPMELELGGWVLAGLVLIAGLWWLNLFNFMDGIDGIAASHTILVLVGMAFIFWLRAGAPVEQAGFWLTMITIGATFGFLLRNWPPARIFMGDAGSNALALVIFALALGTLRDGQVGYQSWLILTSTFVADATITLLRRSARGERPWHAHRRHAYQQLSRRFGHKATTLTYCAITALWCLPLALASEIWTGMAWLLVLFCYLPIVVFCLREGAGQSTE